jgi:hypothetical protein
MGEGQDESLDIIYFNEVFKRDEWTTFEVGKTRFNDQALRKAGELLPLPRQEENQLIGDSSGQVTIHTMRSKRPAYNLISNNCQNFAVNLLDNIQLGAHRDFATALSVYSAATGDGEVVDLFDKHPEDQVEQDDMKADEEEMPKPKRQNTVANAQQVMDEHTTKLDDDHD